MDLAPECLDSPLGELKVDTVGLGAIEPASPLCFNVYVVPGSKCCCSLFSLSSMLTFWLAKTKRKLGLN